MDLRSQGIPHKNWFERNPKKTILCIVAFFFISLDLVLAPFFAERIPNIKSVHYHHDLIADYNGEMTWGIYRYNFKTNSLGFKDNTNRIVAMVNDKYRILFIGDSFTEGVGFTYDDTFVGRIAQQLDKADYEILNAGVSSYSPKLYYLKIKYLIEKLGLRVNEIFVFMDISDVSDDIEYEHYNPSNSQLWDILNRLNFFIKRNSLVANVVIKELIKIKRDLLFKTFYHNSDNKHNTVSDNSKNTRPESSKYWENQDEYLKNRAAWTHNDEVFNKWGKLGFSLAEENMDKLNELCQKYNIKLTIAVYPWPEEITYHNVNSKNVTLWENFCKAKGVHFLNFYPYFLTGERSQSIVERYYVRNDVHFNLAGHKLMAQIWLDNFNSPGSGPSR